MGRTFVFTWLFLTVLPIGAQERNQPPIMSETLFGHQRVATTLSLNKSLTGRWRYNNISSVTSFYDYMKGPSELVSVNSIIYQWHRNIGISGGIQYHFIKGLIPTMALHLSSAHPTWLFVMTPYVNIMPWLNVETIGIVEYKPPIASAWRMFTRLQAFYSYDFRKKQTERTMFYYRLGLMYKKYTFGLGGNADGYRPGRAVIHSFGGFVRFDI